MNNHLIPGTKKWKLKNTIVLMAIFLLCIHTLHLFFCYLDGSLSAIHFRSASLLSIPPIFLIIGSLFNNDRIIRWGRNSIVLLLILTIIALLPFGAETTIKWNHQLFGVWWYSRILMEIIIYCVSLIKSDAYLAE